MSGPVSPTTQSRTWAGRLARPVVLLGACAFVAALIISAQTPARPPSVGPEHDAFTPSLALRYIGEQHWLDRLEFGGSVVGGLSGIDYDAQNDLYYLLSDDRSRFSDARFYTARIDLTSQSFERVSLQTVVTLQKPDGRPFPAYPDMSAADPESIRYDAQRGKLWWTSEGDRTSGLLRGARLVDPFVRSADTQGRYLGELPLPDLFHMRAENRGPRYNETLEGLAIAPDGRSLWVSMEGPLLQDGSSVNVRTGALVRISRLALGDNGSGIAAGQLLTQYAYPVEPVPHAPLVPGALADNGVSEILALSETRLLVLERAYSVGRGMTVRLYEATTEGATDIRQIDALANATVQPMRKRLILDFASLQLATLDNLEAMSWGKPLENGHRSLIFVSDDNFNPAQTTQFLAFEVVPAAAPAATSASTPATSPATTSLQ